MNGDEHCVQAIEVSIPSSATPRAIMGLVCDLAALADSLHRAYAGHGLLFDRVEVHDNLGSFRQGRADKRQRHVFLVPTSRVPDDPPLLLTSVLAMFRRAAQGVTSPIDLGAACPDEQLETAILMTVRETLDARHRRRVGKGLKFPSRDKRLALLDRFRGWVEGFVKIGYEVSVKPLVVDPVEVDS